MQVTVSSWKQNAAAGRYSLMHDKITYDRVIAIGWQDWQCSLSDLIPKTDMIIRIVNALTCQFLLHNFYMRFKSESQRDMIYFKAIRRYYYQYSFKLIINWSRTGPEYMLEGEFGIKRSENLEQMDMFINKYFKDK